MIKPKIQKFVLYQGATWEHVYEVQDENEAIVDLSGCTARLQARKQRTDVDTVLDLEGEVNGPAGQVRFTAGPEDTVDAVWRTAGFDAELYWPGPDGKIDKLGRGTMSLVFEFTRQQ